MQVKYKDKLKVAIIMSSFIVILCYQNCSPMKSNGASDSSSSASSASEQDISTQQAMTILATKCSSCHDNIIKAGGVDVLSVDDMLARGVVVPNEPSLSALFTQIQAGKMPPNKALTQNEAQAIYNWIQDGFKTPPVIVPQLPPETVPLAANFNSINTNILKTKCLGCHNTNNSAGGVSFSTYASTMNTVQRTLPNSSSLYTSVAVRNTMPKGGTPLSGGEINAIRDWITAGAAN